jgi:hypothetical protein
LPTATKNSSRDVLIARMPRMLELEVFELKDEKPDYEQSPKYKNFLKAYADWYDDELISRLRILCVSSKRNALEIFAVYDEFQSR